MEYLDRIIKRHLQQPVQKTLNRIDEQRGPSSKFNAKSIASDIYNSKGYIYDDPDKLVSTIKKIKNIKQYIQVTNELQKLTKGKGIGQYIHTFISNAGFFGKDKSTKYKIVSHLMKVIPKNHWEWTVKTIITWEDVKQLVRQRTGTKDVQIPKDVVLMSIRTEKGILNKLLSDPNLFAAEAGTIEAELGREDTHESLMGLQIGTALMGLGPISAALGLVDAELYRREGNTYLAGLIAVFSLLPGSSTLIKKIPGIEKLGKKGMVTLARKIVSKSKLTPDESVVASNLAKNTKLVNSEADKLINQQITKNAPKLKSLPSKVKSSINPSLTKSAKQGFKFAGTAGLYLYGVPTAYGAVYNKLDPPVTQQDLDKIGAAAEQRVFNKAMASLKRSLDKRSAVAAKKSLSTGLTGLAQTAASFLPGRSNKQESVQPLKEFSPAPETPGLFGQLGDLFSGALSAQFSLSSFAYLGIGIALFSVLGGRGLLRRFRGKTKSVTDRQLPFRGGIWSKIPKFFLTDCWTAIKDIKNLTNVKVPDGKGGITVVNITRSQYNATVARLEKMTMDDIGKIEKQLTAGTITPEQALIDYAAIMPGRFTAQMENYVRLWKEGQKKTKTTSYWQQTSTTPVSTKPKTSPTSAGSAGSAAASSTWKFPNVTPEQFKTLNVSDKLYLQANPKAFYDTSKKGIKRAF